MNTIKDVEKSIAIQMALVDSFTSLDGFGLEHDWRYLKTLLIIIAQS